MDGLDYLRFALALVFVLAMIGLLAALARRAGFGFPAKSLKPGGNRRLSVVEVTQVDGRRRLVLVRRDDVEHLLLISPTSELVVERDIAPRANFADEIIKTGAESDGAET
ncbi:MAG: hypothetical protein HOH04_17530 [Rhodospirillaceae bacterium]|jgi:flagellar protein FliO/FliZ|nr:hypothetical protein [Rhodospirillaceae bacterium]